jgi:hypothetical protein
MKQSREIIRWPLCVLSSYFCFVIGGVAWAQLTGDPANMPMPVIDHGDEVRHLAVEIEFSASGDPEIISTSVGTGYFRRNPGAPDMVRADVFDDEGDLVRTMNLWHPLEGREIGEDGIENYVQLDSARVTLYTDLAAHLGTLVITDLSLPSPVEMIRTDLRPVVRDYCSENPEHGQCLYEVEIDIQPYDPDNRLVPPIKGSIWVAILGTSGFDVSNVDKSSLSFGPAGAQREGAPTSRIDVDGDGYIDLLVRFKGKATGITTGDSEACLSGLDYDGLVIEGCDSITTFQLQ